MLTLALAMVAGLAGGALPSTHAATSDPSAAVPVADAHVETVHDRPADHLTAFDGDLYFTSGDAAHGWEIWRSDGTPQGTALLKDVKRGKPSSYPTGLTATKDAVFFFAKGKRGRTDLWKSDGTRSGTVAVKRDLWVNTYDVESIGVGRLLYFFAFTGRQDPLALWRSDGTAAGTFPVLTNVKLGWPDPKFSDDDADDEMVAVGSRLFFAADGDRNGTELWVSNGTKRGTKLVKDIVSKRNKGAEPAFLTAVGTTLFFTANDGRHGRELWRSNGKSVGTVMVADFTSDPYRDPGPGELTAVGHTLYLNDNKYYPSQLWKSDGTQSGTELVADLDAGDFAALGDTLFFQASGGDHYEVWTSDGTPEGTTQLTNLEEECVSPGVCRRPSRLTPIGESLYFAGVARDQDYKYEAYELWKTDGTSAGTGMIDAFAPPGGDPGPAFDPPVDVSGVPFFLTNDSNGAAQRILKVVDGPQTTPTCQGIPATITGSGAITGTARADVIVGSASSDTIDPRGGDDLICAGAGDDVVLQGEAKDGADSINGQDGDDTVSYEDRSSPVLVRLYGSSSGADYEGDITSGIENALGGSAADRLEGDDADNLLDGGMGDDTLVGSNGDDVELGGPGKDTFDRNWWVNGADVLDGGDGVDKVDFEDRSEPLVITIDAGSGDDGAAGEGDTITDIETLTGGYRDDVIVGSDDDERLDGGEGNDQLTGGGGADTLLGSYDDDHLDLEDGIGGNDHGDGGGGTNTATADPGDILVNVP